MKRRQTRTSAGKEKLNKRWVRQMLRGYRALNKITAAERRAWLERMTVEEARKIFDELHQDTDRWKEDGGTWTRSNNGGLGDSPIFCRTQNCVCDHRRNGVAVCEPRL